MDKFHHFFMEINYMIYDIIVGSKLSENHCNILHFSREEFDNLSTVEMYKKLCGAVEGAVNTTLDIPFRDRILSVLTTINGHLYKKGEVTDADEIVVTEAFEVLAYFGLEAFAVRRDDLLSPTVDERSVRAYIINTTEGGKTPRLSPALGISSTEISMGSTSDIVMEIYRSKIRLNPELDGIIELEQKINNWETLSEVGAGYEFDSSDLLTLLRDKGYRVKIFLQR